MELPSDDGNPQMELPRKRSKPGPKLRAQAAVKDKDFEIVGGDNKAGERKLQNKALANLQSDAKGHSAIQRDGRKIRT